MHARARNMDLSSDDLMYELFMSHLQKPSRSPPLAAPHSLRSNG